MIITAFLGMCFAWSFSWFAIKLQSNSFIEPELSTFYRFLLTTILMIIICKISKQRCLIKKSELKLLPIIGLTNFSLNFLIGYFSVKFIASGIVAMIFSLSILTSEIISAIFNKHKIKKKIIISSIVGFVGLSIFILPSIDFNNNHNNDFLIGLALSILMMIIYSFGTVLVGINKEVNNTPLYTTITYCSGFGTIFLLVINLVKNNNFTIDYSLSYLGSLFYLVFISTILAFICLFYLIQKIGSTRANYTALIYPIIAIITSMFLENLKLNLVSVIGILMIISAIAIEFFYNPKLLKYNIIINK